MQDEQLSNWRAYVAWEASNVQRLDQVALAARVVLAYEQVQLSSTATNSVLEPIGDSKSRQSLVSLERTFGALQVIHLVLVACPLSTTKLQHDVMQRRS